MNDTNIISKGINYVFDYPDIPLWMKALVLLGAIYLFRITVNFSSMSLTGIVYIIGAIKWLYYKIMRRQI